jgi:carbamate kinase
VDELRGYAAAGHFASGSMGPKVEAACRFVTAGGARAAIAALDSIAEAAAGRAGTVVQMEGGA